MKTTFTKLIAQLESLTKSNGENAYKTACILKDLWASRDFAESCKNNLDEMESKLAKYSGRFALGVHDLLQMVNEFPNKRDWVSGRLDVLRDKTCSILASRARGNNGEKEEKEPIKRKHVTTAQYNALQEKYDKLLIKFKTLEKEHRALLRAIGPVNKRKAG